MPPFGLSAVVRTARRLGRRAFEPDAGEAAMVVPQGRYAPRPHDGVLVLQQGSNPSTDYYLRPRLRESDVPVVYADLADSPRGRPLAALAGAQALLVVICRYGAGPWLSALESMSGRLARVAYFMDDDLPAMCVADAIPQAYRRRIVRRYADHVERLSKLASEVWVSSAVLADRYPMAQPVLLEPLPDEDLPEPSEAAPRLVVYHATGVHGPERQFVVDVARRLADLGCDAEIEITGDGELRRSCADLARVRVVPQQSWPRYRERQRGRRAAIALAPLFPTAINDARAPVKAFEAARLGAAGLYADAEPYRRAVDAGVDGLLLPMEVELWARTIASLLDDTGHRHALARAAWTRLAGLRALHPNLPSPTR